MRFVTLFQNFLVFLLTSAYLVHAADPEWMQKRQVSNVQLRSAATLRLQRRTAVISDWVHELHDKLNGESDYGKGQLSIFRDVKHKIQERQAAKKAAFESLKRQLNYVLDWWSKHGHNPNPQPQPSGPPKPPGQDGTCADVGRSLAELLLDLASLVKELKQSCSDGTLSNNEKEAVFEQIEHIDEIVRDITESLVKSLGQCLIQSVKKSCKGKIDWDGRASLHLLAGYINGLK